VLCVEPLAFRSEPCGEQGERWTRGEGVCVVELRPARSVRYPRVSSELEGSAKRFLFVGKDWEGSGECFLCSFQ